MELKSDLFSNQIFVKQNNDEYGTGCEYKSRLLLTERRHVIPMNCLKDIQQDFRMKERMKTVSIALVFCLNLDVDPPDICRTVPCARTEAWIDPRIKWKSLEMISTFIQQQFELWQPRARYKLLIDPVMDDVRKLCVSLRRNSKHERVLFYYNGHGVPRPTTNKEIWVFNKNLSQYIALSLCDLFTWMGSPSIYIYDCSASAHIIHSFEALLNSANNSRATVEDASLFNSFSTFDSIHLAACGSNEVLPMHASLPADLFTCCLTTPIKMALRWRFLVNRFDLILSGLVVEDLDRIPGQLNDRRTMLGELNWIFTAITDTIAWNMLPKQTFQRLFRQDLFVASMFRNYLLACRIMKSCDCNPDSYPRLPDTSQHSLWNTWDMSVDICLINLKCIKNSLNSSIIQFHFFEDQLTAFQVWLDFSNRKYSMPEQLPIILQVLLSQAHRVRALELLCRFMDISEKCVINALAVGIFPYVLKLLLSSAKELRLYLVVIWAKIVAIDNTSKIELVRETYPHYFIQILVDDSVSLSYKTLAVFVLAGIVYGQQMGKEVALKQNIFSTCMELIVEDCYFLQIWTLILMSRLWHHFDRARWIGVRELAHEKIFDLLTHQMAEIRACAVHALGTFLSAVKQRTEHADSVDHVILMTILSHSLYDPSFIVRRELVCVFSIYIQYFRTKFELLVKREILENENLCINNYNTVTGVSGLVAEKISLEQQPTMHRVASYSCLQSSSSTILSDAVATNLSVSFGSLTSKIWESIKILCEDPDVEVCQMANKLKFHLLENFKASVSEASEANKTVLEFCEESTYRSALFHTNLIAWLQEQILQPMNIYENKPDFISNRVFKSTNIRMNSIDYETQCKSTIKLIESSDSFTLKHSFSTANRPVKLAISHKFSSPLTDFIFNHCHSSQFMFSEYNKVWICDDIRDYSMQVINNHTSSDVQIKRIHLVNPSHMSRVLVASDDAIIRIWDSSVNDSSRIMSCWRVHFDSVYNQLTCSSYNQRCASFVAASVAICVYDLSTELCTHRITDSRILVSSIDLSDNKLMLFGRTSGNAKIYDLRTSSKDAQYHFQMQKSINTSHIHDISVLFSDSTGLISIYDLRQTKKVISRFKLPNDVNSIDIHPYFDIIGCVHSKQNIMVTDFSGSILNTCSDRTRFNPSFVSFPELKPLFRWHPHKFIMSTYILDSQLNIYTY